MVHTYMSTYPHTYKTRTLPDILWVQYIHTYIYTYIHIDFVHRHTEKFPSERSFLRDTYIHEYLDTHTHTHTHKYIHIYRHTLTCIHTYIHTYIHTRRQGEVPVGAVIVRDGHIIGRGTYIHTYVHTYIHTYTETGGSARRCSHCSRRSYNRARFQRYDNGQRSNGACRGSRH